MRHLRVRLSQSKGALHLRRLVLEAERGMDPLRTQRAPTHRANSAPGATRSLIARPLGLIRAAGASTRGPLARAVLILRKRSRQGRLRVGGRWHKTLRECGRQELGCVLIEECIAYMAFSHDPHDFAIHNFVHKFQRNAAVSSDQHSSTALQFVAELQRAGGVPERQHPRIVAYAFWSRARADAQLVKGHGPPVAQGKNLGTSVHSDGLAFDYLCVRAADVVECALDNVKGVEVAREPHDVGDTLEEAGGSDERHPAARAGRGPGRAAPAPSRLLQRRGQRLAACDAAHATADNDEVLARRGHRHA